MNGPMLRFLLTTAYLSFILPRVLAGRTLVSGNYFGIRGEGHFTSRLTGPDVELMGGEICSASQLGQIRGRDNLGHPVHGGSTILAVRFRSSRVRLPGLGV